MELSNIKQELFCKYYVMDPETMGNGAASMRKAGYSEGYVKGGSTRMLKLKHVNARISELKEVSAKHTDKSINKRKYNAQSILEEVDLAKEIAVKANEWRGVLDAAKFKSEFLGYKDNPSRVKDDLGIEEDDSETVDSKASNIIKPFFGENKRAA